MMKLVWISLLFILSFNSFAQQKAAIKITDPAPYVMGDLYHAEFIFWPKGDVTVDQVRGLAGNILPGGKWFVGKVNRARESENNEQALVADMILVPVAAQDNTDAGVIKFGEEFYALTINAAKVEEVKPVSEKFLALDQKIKLPGQIPWSQLTGVLIIIALAALGYMYWKRRKKAKRELEAKESIDWSERIKNAGGRKDMERLYASREKWAGVVVPKEREVIEFFELMYRHQYKKEWSPEIEDQVVQALSKVKERVGDQLS